MMLYYILYNGRSAGHHRGADARPGPELPAVAGLPIERERGSITIIITSINY